MTPPATQRTDIQAEHSTSRWSWTIGRIAGIGLQVHATFLLLLLWIALTEYQRVGTGVGAIEGVLTRADLLRALAEGKQTVSVADVMQRNFAATAPDEMLTSALARLEARHCQTLPIVQQGALVGVLTMENIGEFVALGAAIRAGHRQTSHSPFQQ